jgi:hypothetical protein
VHFGTTLVHAILHSTHSIFMGVVRNRVDGNHNVLRVRLMKR